MLPAAAVTVLFVALLLAAEWRGSQRGRWLFKPVASAGFVAFAVAAGALESAYGIAVLVALVLSWWGDVLLIPKDKRAFLAGLIAFLAGHVGFAAAFVLLGVSAPATLLAGLVLGALALPVGRWVVRSAPPRMRGPVVAYIVVISSMLALAFGAAFGEGTPLMAGAAALFYASDLAVARNRFVAPGFVNKAWGLPAYYGAQLLFGLTLLGW